MTPSEAIRAFPPGWRIAAASVPGRAHVAAGLENQDAVAYRRVGNGFVVALADGASSAAHAATGARLAVDAACDAASCAMPEPPTSPVALARAGRLFVQHCLRIFDQRLDALVRAGSAPRDDYATTLVAVVAQPPGYCYINVGDGFVVVARRRGGQHLVSAPTGEEGRTPFLTTGSRERWITSGVLLDGDLEGIALGSDGVIEGVLASGGAASGPREYVAPESFAGYFAAIAAGADPVELHRHLLSTDFEATSGDDKSMIVAVRA